MAKPDVWMPLYIADYLADTGRLTTEQHGAYLLLMMDYWRNGPLPADDVALAQITRLSPAAWKKNKVAVTAFFRLADGNWHHKRIDAELADANSSIERNRANGRKGGRPKKQNPEVTNHITQNKPTGFENDNPEERPSPSPSQSERHNQSDLSSSALPGTAGSASQVAASPPGYHPRFREVQQRVEKLLNSPSLTVFSRIDGWLKNGADPEIDIYPSLERCRQRWTGTSLNYFDNAIADSIADRTRLLPAGDPGRDRPVKFDPVAHLAEKGLI